MRIVSLCPSLTELVFDLGRGAELVGITDYCVHPAERVGALEKVGGTKTPDVARIVELAPGPGADERGGEPPRGRRGAAPRPACRCHASMPRTAAETAAMVRSIGEALGARRGRRGDRARHRGPRRARAPRGRAARERALRLPDLAQALDVASTATPSPTRCSRRPAGVNVFGERTERYPEVTLEELAARAARPRAARHRALPVRGAARRRAGARHGPGARGASASPTASTSRGTARARRTASITPRS